jgi:hypothetical protein
VSGLDGSRETFEAVSSGTLSVPLEVAANTAVLMELRARG